MQVGANFGAAEEVLAERPDLVVTGVYTTGALKVLLRRLGIAVYEAETPESFEAIRDVTKPVTFTVEFGGFGTDPWGNYKAGATAKTVINREDFGLTWNAALETGGVLVGKDVTITLDLQGSLQA